MAYGGMIQQPMTTPYQDQATMYQRPVGMQEGGVVDRTQFSMGQSTASIQTRKYINPKTKEVRSFNFIGTTALGVIPEGFVPWTQELQDQTTEAPVDTSTTTATQNDQRDGDRGRDRENQGQQGNSYGDWAKENYADMMSDPFSVGMRELNSIGKDVGLIGAIPGVGGVIGLANDMKTMDAISKAESALSRIDPNSSQAKELQLAIDAAADKINSGAVKTAYEMNLIGQGTQVTNAINSVDPSKTTGRTTITDRIGTSTAGATRRSIFGDTDSSGGVTRSGGRDQQGTTGRVDPGLSQAVKDRAGQAAVDKALEVGRGIQGNRAADKALADKAAAQASKEKEAASRAQGDLTRRAEGGLISKPQKTVRNKKGLAS
jgi:hypothetical protein